MHRPGADPSNMVAEDFLCDFCAASWSETRPMVEGHHGSLICGPCLTIAVIAVRDAADAPAANGEACTMCLEIRDEAHWSSPAQEARICSRCVDQAVRVITKDRDSGWRAPE